MFQANDKKRMFEVKTTSILYVGKMCMCPAKGKH